ncbi:MAG: DUF6391 domain-containing protein [Chloroflexota bacterium]|nr:DUF6391 domain-containing protein [Chloroflexota bacterium]
MGFVRRTRQHHAIEHATVTMLTRRNQVASLVGGRSDHRGFYIFGDVDTEVLQRAVDEAITRLRAGEARLAIHPNCGTNLVTTGALAGLATFAATMLTRRNNARIVDQIPVAIMAGIGGMMLGRPAGTRLQRQVTTLADIGGLKLGSITRGKLWRWNYHFVTIDESI